MRARVPENFPAFAPEVIWVRETAPVPPRDGLAVIVTVGVYADPDPEASTVTVTLEVSEVASSTR